MNLNEPTCQFGQFKCHSRENALMSIEPNLLAFFTKEKLLLFHFQENAMSLLPWLGRRGFFLWETNLSLTCYAPGREAIYYNVFWHVHILFLCPFNEVHRCLRAALIDWLLDSSSDDEIKLSIFQFYCIYWCYLY